MKKRVLAVGALAILLTLPAAQGQSPAADEAQALSRLKRYSADLVSTLPEADRAIAQRVVLHAPATGSLAQVGAAVAPDGTPFISINQGTQYAMQQLGQATVLAVQVLQSDSFLMGYIRYLAYWDQFGGWPMTAVQFARHYGVADAQARLNALSDAQRGTGQGVEVMMMLFITAHELAHHVNGDVNRGLLAAEDQRKQEARADAWAAQRVMALGYNPEMALMSLLVMNQIERARPPSTSLLRRHPEALRRAQDLMRSVLDNLDTHPQAIRAELARTPGGPNFETYAEALRRIDQQLQAQAQAQRRLDTDPMALQASAKRANIRSQLRLSELLQTGEMDGLPRNRKAARFWAEAAALNDAPHEFFDSAYAAYMAGTLVANDGDDNGRACYYMGRAASMSLTLGVSQLAQLKKSGVCGR